MLLFTLVLMLRATSLGLTSLTETLFDGLHLYFSIPSQILAINAQVIKNVFFWHNRMLEAHFLVFDFVCPVLELAVFPDVSVSLA